MAHLMLERESIGEVRLLTRTIMSSVWIVIDRAVVGGVYIGERYICGGNERSWMFSVGRRPLRHFVRCCSSRLRTAVSSFVGSGKRRRRACNCHMRCPSFLSMVLQINTVLPDVPPSDFDLLAMADDASECTSLKDTATLKNKNKMQRASEDGRLSALTIDGLEAAAVEKKTEKKKKKTDKLVLYGNDGQEIMDVTGRNSTNQKNQKRGFELGTNDFNFLGYSKPSILEEELPFTMSSVEEGNLESKIIHDSLDGPKIICRPSWPNYYEKNAQGRGRIYIDGPEDYLESLELRRDEYGEPMIPHKYRIRYRVGRGGRLIADKVPVCCGCLQCIMW